MRRLCTALAALLAALACGAVPASAAKWPIRHVVIIYQENHSFDNVLGKLCVHDRRCDGATTGRLKGGAVITLPKAKDIIPEVTHSPEAQDAAIDHGRMDGFSTFNDCTRATHYQCYQQYWPRQIPNLAALARRYVISDRTYELDRTPSWGSHMDLVATTMDGFTGINPQHHPGAPLGPDGWGCDSFTEAFWKSSPRAAPQLVPSCIPRRDGSGPFRRSPVSWVPTIMDRLDAAGVSWRLYTPTPKEGFYGFAICPTFADCIYSRQRRNMRPTDQVIDDARAGRLPGFSIVTPTSQDSQHNSYSMLRGDNWLGRVVSAIQHGRNWGSTAIFITYDDCGCFYDHSRPPRPGLGIREPMVIVSPYARKGHTDSHVASFASLLAFTEHVFHLRPLTSRDAKAYDYRYSFRFHRRRRAPTHFAASARTLARGRTPAPPIPVLRRHPLPLWEQRLLAHMPHDDDMT